MVWLDINEQDSDEGSLGQDLSKYTVPASIVGMSVPTTVVYFLPIKNVRMLNVILSTNYKNIRNLQ